MTIYDLYVRALNSNAFRAWSWAKVVSVKMIKPPGDLLMRPCFKVQFPDGQTDFWPIYDTGHDYEFSWRPEDLDS